MGTTLVAFRIDNEIVEQLRDQAKREDRSLSSLLRRVIDKYLKEQGARKQVAKEANND